MGTGVFLARNIEVITPANPITEPTERSNTPAINSTVIPIPIRMFGAMLTCSESILLMSRKMLFLASRMRITTTISTLIWISR